MLGLLSNMQFPLNSEKWWKKGRCLINPVWLPWFGSLKALAPLREVHTFCLWVFLRGLFFHPMVSTPVELLALLHLSQPLPCGVEARAVRALGPGRCKAFSSGFPPTFAFFSQIMFSPMFCDPWSVQWNWPRLLGNRIHGLLIMCGDVSAKS